MKGYGGLLQIGMWLCFGMSLWAGTFEEANTALEEKRYEDAIQLYKKNLAENGERVGVRYNLGIAREGKGELGGAIVEWERVLRADAMHEGAREKLKELRKKIGAREVDALWFTKLRPQGVVGEETLYLICFTWVAIGGVAVWWGMQKQEVGVTLLVLGLLGGGAAYGWKVLGMWEDRLAVVVSEKVLARKVPAVSGNSLGEWMQGTVVEVLQESAGWSLCRLSEDTKGWVDSKSIERIKGQ